MAILLLVIAALVPIAMTPGIVLYHDVTPKVVVLLLGVAATAVLFAFRGPASRQWRPGVLGVLLLAQFCLLAASTALSERLALSVSGTIWRRFGLLEQSALLLYAYLVAATFASQPGLWRWALRVLAGSGAAAALYGIAQYFGVDPLLDAASYRVGEGVWMIVRPPSTLGHANYAGIIYLQAAFAGAGLVATAERRVDRALGWTAMALGAVAAVFGGSRAAMLGLGAGAAVFALMHRKGITWRPFAIAAAAVMAFAIFYVTPPGERLRARTRWFVEDPAGGGRLLLWRGVIAMGAARPLTGWGPETFTGAFACYQPEELSAAYPDFYNESAHNIFLDTMATQGIGSIVVLMAVCYLGFRAALRAPDRRFGAAIAAALASILTALQFSAFILPTALCLYFWVALGAAAGAEQIPGGRGSVQVAAGTEALANRRWRRRAVRWLLVIPSALWAYFAVTLAIWDGRLMHVERTMRGGSVEAAMSAWAGAKRIAPYGVNADLWYSRRMFAVSQSSPYLLARAAALQEAMRAGIDATATAEDRHNAWYHLATVYAQAGRQGETEAALRHAIEEMPRWFKPRWALARLLLLTGRRQEAVQEAFSAVRLSGGKLAEVNATLQQVQAAEHQK